MVSWGTNIHVKGNMLGEFWCACVGLRGLHAWQWGVAVGPSTWQLERGSVAVGAWQRGSGAWQWSVAVWQWRRGSVAVAACHGSLRHCQAPPLRHCHAPPLPHCHAPLVLVFFWGGVEFFVLNFCFFDLFFIFWFCCIVLYPKQKRKTRKQKKQMGKKIKQKMKKEFNIRKITNKHI